MKKTHLMLPLDQSDGATHDSPGDEVITGMSFLDDFDDRAGGLVEGFNRGVITAAGKILRFGEHAFVPGLVDIEAKDLAAKHALHDDRVSGFRHARWRRGGERHQGSEKE